MKPKNSDGDKNQKLKLRQNSKSEKIFKREDMTKLKKLDFEKTQKL